MSAQVEGAASADTAAAANEKPWQYAIGRRPHKVVIVERLDRRGALQVRYSFGGQHPKPFLRSPHPQTVRGTDRKGRPCIDPAAEAELHSLAANIRERLVKGEDPMPLIDPPVVTPVVEVVAPATPLTLRQLVDAAAPDLRAQGEDGVAIPSGPTAASRRGVYGADTPEAREFRQLALRGVGALERVLRARGAPLHCEEVRANDWVEAGRLLLDEFRVTPGRRGNGFRITERALGAAIRSGNWATTAGGVALDKFVVPRKGWRKELKLHLQRTRHAPVVVQRERLTEEEAGRFLALMFDPTADVEPRFRVLMALGFPLRAGQVAHGLFRSQAKLDNSGVFGAGRIKIPESGNKPSANFDLHPAERALIERLLAGPLRELEEAYQRKLIEDYPLIPAGRFRKGVLPYEPGQPVPKPMSERRLLEFYNQAEAWVGITHVPGRAWYGLRRTCTDKSAELTKDADERAMLGGWEMEGTRGSVYRDREDPRLLAAVGRVRAALRQQLVSLAPTPAVHTTRAKPALIGRDSAKALEKYRAAHEERARRPKKRKVTRRAARGIGKSARA